MVELLFAVIFLGFLMFALIAIIIFAIRKSEKKLNQELAKKDKVEVSERTAGNDNNDLTIALVFVPILLIAGLATIVSPNVSDKIDNAIPNEIHIQYETNPLTGDTKITSINNTTSEELTDDVMDWLGFDKEEL